MKRAFVFLGSLLLWCHHLCGQSVPETHAISLDETAVDLPGDLKGRPAILVMGFSKSSSKQTKPWADAIKRDFASDTKTVFYQLPMLQEVPRLLRTFVLQGMRKPLNVAERKQFVPIFDNEAAWKDVVHFAGPDDAYVLLVDGSWHIKWQSAGVFQEQKYDGLRKQAAALEH